MKPEYTIRPIQPGDDRELERIIRSCLIEFGGDHEGTAWADPMLGRLSEVYRSEDGCYWAAVSSDGRPAGGCGIGPSSEAGLCELQKMYLIPEVRGTGLAQRLLETALAFASQRYERCFLETLESMTAAQRFYERNGFVRISEPPARTEHFACGVRYIREL